MIVPLPLGAIIPTLTAVVLNIDIAPIDGEFDNVVFGLDKPDATDVPPELVAVTENVYDVLDVNPDTVIGEDVPVPTSPKLLVTV